jgi:hypothetical protein
MANVAKYQPLFAAAEKLAQQAHGDPNVRAQLLADPAKAIVETAGQSLPKGVIVKAAKDAEGKNRLVVEMDPQYNGELDNELLEAVSGGKGGSSASVPGATPTNPFGSASSLLGTNLMFLGPVF